MKRYISSTGYYGYSMSNNAVSAYDNGEKPLSKWTKVDILSELAELDVSGEIIQAAKKLTLADLKNIFLYKSSWHHTSKMYNKTDFYSVNPNVTMSDIQQYSNNKADTNVSTEPNYTFCDVSYGEWEGSKRHPKLVEYDDYAIVKDNWAYVYNDGIVKRKKTNGSHFTITHKYTKVPKDLTEIYEKIKRFI